MVEQIGGGAAASSPSRIDEAVALRTARPLFWWDAAVAVLLVFQGTLGAFEAIDGAPIWARDRELWLRLALVLLPLALFGALHVALGRRVLLRGMRDDPLRYAGAAFLTLLVALLALATFVTPLHAMLQALVYPMIWTTAVRYRDAVLWSAAVALTLGAAMFLGLHLGGSSGALASAAITGPVSFVFSVVMGTWITRIFMRGEQYREVAEQLRRTQAEVAALSQEAGAASERERMSRELHDTLTQTLAGLVMLSEQADRALAAGDAERARDRLSRVASAAREAAGEARALVATTQPLGDGGLEAAIERVAERLRADTGLDVRCDLETVPLDRERQVVLLRAAQEGLANARKHARASAVRVRLAARPGGGAVLRVDDDGVGPGAGTGPMGFGLSGLADRVRHVGGAVRFSPGASGGASLEVLLPPGPGALGGAEASGAVASVGAGEGTGG